MLLHTELLSPCVEGIISHQGRVNVLLHTELLSPCVEGIISHRVNGLHTELLSPIISH